MLDWLGKGYEFTTTTGYRRPWNAEAKFKRNSSLSFLSTENVPYNKMLLMEVRISWESFLRKVKERFDKL